MNHKKLCRIFAPFTSNGLLKKMNMNPNAPRQQVIVSMTSFPAAIAYAERAVRSILAGSVLPDKVVLYLTFAQFGEGGIPKGLLKLAEENPVFEVRDYGRDIRSYRKLIPALHDFPEAVIPTTDDIWFWAAAVANGTPIVPVPFGHNKPRGLGKPRELS